jgi:AcrR family transcriptional regulator
MARPIHIDDKRLLAIARALFLEKGAAATTEEIARRAGIAQGSIFRRYKTKEELFHAAMLSEPPEWIANLQERARTLDLPDALIQTGLEIIAFQRKVLPVMVVTWTHRKTFVAPRGFGGPEAFPGRAGAELIAFFGTQIQAGKLRARNPMELAAAYMGALASYVLIELVRGKHPLPAEQFVEGFVRLLWSGIRPEGNPS